MDEKILNAISDLRVNVSERIGQIINLVESCPEISSKLNYEAVVEALFTPPKRSVTEIKVNTSNQGSVSDDLDKSILSNPLNLVELPIDSSNSELSNVFDFSSLSNKELIENDNFDPLLITDDENNDSKTVIPSKRSNLDLLLDLNHVTNNVSNIETLIPEELVSSISDNNLNYENHENSRFSNTAPANKNNNNFKNNSFEILSNGDEDFLIKNSGCLPKNASPPPSLHLVDDYQDLKKTALSSDLVKVNDYFSKESNSNNEFERSSDCFSKNDSVCNSSFGKMAETIPNSFQKKSESLDLVDDNLDLKKTSFRSDFVQEKVNDYYSKESDSLEFVNDNQDLKKTSFRSDFVQEKVNDYSKESDSLELVNDNQDLKKTSFRSDFVQEKVNDYYSNESVSLEFVNDNRDLKNTSFRSELLQEKLNDYFSKNSDSNNEFERSSDCFSKNDSVCNSSFGKMAETIPNSFKKLDEFEDKDKLDDFDFSRFDSVTNYPLVNLKQISEDSQDPIKEISLTYMPVPKYDQFIDVIIAEVNNSRNFYLYINEEYKLFSDNFNDYYQCLLKNDKKIEDLKKVELKFKKIYSIFSQEDGRFYRGQLLQHAYLENFWTLLVDYGKIKAVHSKNFYELDSEFEEYPIMALSCFLDVSWNKDCKELETGFFELMRRKSPQEHSMQIRAKFEQPIHNRYPVSLIVKPMGDDNWKSLADFKVKIEVSDELNNRFFDFSKFYADPLLAYTKTNLESFFSFCGLLTLKSPHVTLDTKFTAVSPYVYTISKFLCIIQSYENSGTCDPEHFTTNLSFFYENYALEADSKLNSLIVFRHKGFFFRGFILKCTSKEYQVLSIDFAFIANNVSMDNIFPLVDYFALEKYPMFACLCSLDNVMPASKAWSPLAFETFRTWVQFLQKFTIIPKMFLKFTHSMYSVDLKLQNNEQSASELLIKMKYGIPMVEKIVN